MTTGTVITKDRAVKLVNHFASCRLMKTVNVLGDDGLQLAHIFQLGKSYVTGVWLGIRVNEILFIKGEEFFRIADKKSVGY